MWTLIFAIDKGMLGCRPQVANFDMVEVVQEAAVGGEEEGQPPPQVPEQLLVEVGGAGHGCMGRGYMTSLGLSVVHPPGWKVLLSALVPEQLLAEVGGAGHGLGRSCIRSLG